MFVILNVISHSVVGLLTCNVLCWVVDLFVFFFFLLFECHFFKGRIVFWFYGWLSVCEKKNPLLICQWVIAKRRAYLEKKKYAFHAFYFLVFFRLNVKHMSKEGKRHFFWFWTITLWQTLSESMITTTAIEKRTRPDTRLPKSCAGGQGQW